MLFAILGNKSDTLNSPIVSYRMIVDFYYSINKRIALSIQQILNSHSSPLQDRHWSVLTGINYQNRILEKTNKTTMYNF